MSERFTRKDAERAFDRLCELFGEHRAAGYDDKGGWILDYAPIYGGYVVGRLEEHGGESRPFGDYRRSARDFWQMVWDITRAFELRDRHESEAV